MEIEDLVVKRTGLGAIYISQWGGRGGCALGTGREVVRSVGGGVRRVGSVMDGWGCVGAGGADR